VTTIAWDGKTLAADTLGAIGECLRVCYTKIFRLDDGRLFGGAGNYEDVLAVRDWLNKDSEKKPRVTGFAAILIGRDGTCARLEDRLVPLPIVERWHACGSGRDFAIAAMVCGLSAEKAVDLAMQLDVWSGGTIDALTLEEGGPRCL